MSSSDAMRELGGQELPAEIKLDGKVFCLRDTFVCTPRSSVGLYEAGSERVVLKLYGSRGLFNVPVAWLARRMASHEAAVLRALHDLRGVPRFRGRYGRTGLLRDYVPGEPLTRHTEVGEDFFPAFFRLLERMHERGVAYVDLEKADNILRGEDGLPHLIDFQLAFHWPERLLGRTLPARCLRGWFQRSDLYHARKHLRRLKPAELTEEQVERTRRKPGLVRLSNMVFAPYKKLRRRLLGKE